MSGECAVFSLDSAIFNLLCGEDKTANANILPDKKRCGYYMTVKNRLDLLDD